jgi:ATP-dependent Lon protease
MLAFSLGMETPANKEKGRSQMSANVAIPIAGFKDVYDVTEVEKALHELPASANEALRAVYEKMLRLGGQRFTVKPSALPEMDALFEELPNFTEVLEDIRKHLALCIDSNDCVEVPPMLLLGEPGIGKTHFARKISQLLGTGFGFVPMSSLTAGWVLSGASSQWKNAKPGKVFDTFVNGDYANPVIVVDEIDKASADGQYDPLGALYELLEVETATRFVDEFVELPIDASGAVWLATANDVGRIPEPLLSRLAVYEIEAPDAEGSARIARNIYAEIRSSHDWGRQFPETLSPGALEKLASLPPREMRRAIHCAFGNAKIAGRSEVGADDIQDQRARKQRIGF